MEEKKQNRRGRPRKYDGWTPELLQERAGEYFRKCDSRERIIMGKKGPVVIPNPIPYSIEGLCVYLDVSRREFDTWRKRSDPLGDRARKLHLRITANRIEGALDGTQNSAFAQFMLKNNSPDHYRDKIEVENSVGEEAAAMFDAWSKLWKKK